MKLNEGMSGKQLAEVLTFLSGQVQEGVNKGSDIVDQLRAIVDVLEAQNDSEG